jgi:hypothetical protein
MLNTAITNNMMIAKRKSVKTGRKSCLSDRVITESQFNSFSVELSIVI